MHFVELGRNIYLAGAIGWQDLADISLTIQTLVQKDRKRWINLYITSPGGEVGAGLALYDFIKIIAKPKLQTIIIREADSMAVVVALAGNHRVITSSATMFFHDISQQVEENSRIPRWQAKRIVKNLDARFRDYVAIISRNSNLSIKEATRLDEDERRINAQEALKFGLVHEIIK